MPKRTPPPAPSPALAAKRIGIFPGQFDPPTLGHLDIIRRGKVLFDHLVVAVGINPDKKELIPHAKRVKLLQNILADTRGVSVEGYTGLTVDFAKQLGATAILRGIRDATDLRYELQLALANRTVGSVETVFIMTGDHFALTSSSLIRQVIQLGGDVASLKAILPKEVLAHLKNLQKTSTASK